MNSEMLIKQVELVRSITLEVFDSITEDMADIQPNGFHNTIRWNLGHILIVQDELCHHFAQLPRQLPDEYVKLFGNRTKPADWTQEPPALDLLHSLLKEQTVFIKKELAYRLDENATKPFIRLKQEMRTVGEILNFSLHHEGMHLGLINGLKRGIEGTASPLFR